MVTTGSNNIEITSCGLQVTSYFIENEVAFSSLEQVANLASKDIKMEVDREPEPPTFIKQETSFPSNQANFRNVLHVEESSVVLQVAGELMDISVNIVNGKSYHCDPIIRFNHRG